MLKRVRAAAGTEGSASSEPAPFRNSGPKKQHSRPIWVSLIGPAVILAVIVFGLYGLMRIGVWSTTRIVSQGAGLGVGIQRKRQLQQQRLDRWRVATDSTITPFAAGMMLHELSRAGRDSTLLQWERPIDSTYPAPKCCEQFTRAAAARFDAKVDWTVAAFAVARRGFNVEQRSFLRGLAQSPALSLFRVVARAPEADLGAVWEVPADATVSAAELPLMRLQSLRSLASSNVAAAALDLEAGRTAVAEQRLREVISIGFLVQRGGRSTIEENYGSILVNYGRASLEGLYAAVGRNAEAALVSAKSDSAIPSTIGNSNRVRTDDLYATLRRRILDTTEMTGTRWQLLLGPFAYLPCTSVRQMIFGASKQHRESLEEFRVALVKYPSDARRFTMTARSMGQLIDPAWRGRPNVRDRPAWAAAVSSVTRNRQLEQCAALFRR
jgi:hypothetical protein